MNTDSPNTWELLKSRAALIPDRIALSGKGLSITYGSLVDRVEAKADKLRKAAAPGDVVLVDVTSDPVRAVISYFGSLAVGAVTAFIPSGGGWRRDALARSVGASLEAGPNGVTRIGHRPDWAKAIADPAVIVFTSGTMGAPKPVVHSHSSLLWNLWNTASVADEILYGAVSVPNDANSLTNDLAIRGASPYELRFFTTLPLDAISGISVMHRALMFGDVFVLPQPFGAAGLFDMIASNEITNLGLSPVAAEQLLRHGARHGRASGLLSLSVGGALVKADMVARLDDMFSCATTSGYGSTELGGLVCMSRPYDPIDVRATTVGRPIASVKVAISPDGELLVCTPARSIGYLRHGLLVADAAMWRGSGDRAEMRGERVVVRGRIDGVIVRGGRRIDPVSVEDLLESLPVVHRAGVTGVPARGSGYEDVVALVVANSSVTVSDLRRLCAEFGPELAPQRVLMVPTLPLTRDGSIARRELRDLAARLVGGDRRELIQ